MSGVYEDPYPVFDLLDHATVDYFDPATYLVHTGVLTAPKQSVLIKILGPTPIHDRMKEEFDARMAEVEAQA